MKRVRRVLSGAAAALMLGGAVQALEPALDPLPDLSAYPTQLLVDGQAVEEGAVPGTSARRSCYPCTAFWSRPATLWRGTPGRRGRPFPEASSAIICWTSTQAC